MKCDQNSAQKHEMCKPLFSSSLTKGIIVCKKKMVGAQYLFCVVHYAKPMTISATNATKPSKPKPLCAVQVCAKVVSGVGIMTCE